MQELRPVAADEMERILRALIAEHPEGSKEHRNAQWQLMRLLSHVGRHQEGLGILDALLDSTVDPEARGEIILAMGQTLEQLDEYASASEVYSHGIGLEPVGVRTAYLLHNNLAYCLNQLGRHVEAESWCRGAIQIDPLRHNAHKNLGVAFQGQGEYVKAARSFIQAVHREVSDPRALEHLRELVEAHPEIQTDIPDIHEQLERCSTAVGMVSRMQQWSGTPPESQSN
jgi:tetratricopeptide (TPR) repeat protein